MITNTAEIKSSRRTARPRWQAWIVAALMVLLLPSTRAQTVLGPWVPIFKGVEHTVGTNTPGAGQFAELQVVNALRIDLSDPDIQLFATPRVSPFSLDSHETAGLTVSNFLNNFHLQVAVNANNFHDPGTTDSPSYTLPEGTPFEVAGVQLSRGQIVSLQEATIVDSAAFMFGTNNQASFVPTNYPAHSIAGMYTAVSGLYALLVNGVNVGSNYNGNTAFLHQANPRTAMGLSQDGRYLFVLTIDGRQSGYSDGALDWETAAWLLMVGAWNGANMDGGGSTTMVMQDSTGFPVELNHDSAAADPATARERTVGSHFGVFAKPLPVFINDVHALPDDTAATVTWTTIAPATSQVQYGPTPAFGSSTPLQSSLVTNHAALLPGLTPSTGYYFQITSTAGGNLYTSSNFYFLTTNYVITTSLFDFTNVWTFGTANLDGVNWTAPAYDSSAWDGSGPGLLWADIRGYPNASIPEPMLTVMPLNPASSYPFTTYYFRTHFAFTNSIKGVALQFTDYIDDGGVFYLNGAEIFRVRMPAAPTAIYNSTQAAALPCSGDATCPDYFTITGPLAETNLVANDNVLAVEIHNVAPTSRDITFGASLAFTEPYTLSPPLAILSTNGTVTLSWNRGGFTLQQADAPTGTWTDSPGPVVSSPYVLSMPSASRYFRLRK